MANPNISFCYVPYFNDTDMFLLLIDAIVHFTFLFLPRRSAYKIVIRLFTLYPRVYDTYMKGLYCTQFVLYFIGKWSVKWV